PEEFVRFDRVVDARGHSPEAIDLAYDRMAGPFLAASECGYIEREWMELESDQQRSYLRAAVKRETLLLERDNDLTRAQSANSGGELLHALWASRLGRQKASSYLFGQNRSALQESACVAAPRLLPWCAYGR